MTNIELTQRIENEIRIGLLSFRAIATFFDVSIQEVNDVWDAMCQTEFVDE